MTIKSNLKTLGINIAVLAALTSFVEVMAFTALTIRDQFRETNTDKIKYDWNFEMHPGVGHAHLLSDFTKSPNAKNANSFNSLYTERKYGNAKKSINFLLLGGSTTDPLGERFSGIDGTWENHMFNELKKNNSVSFKVINAGVGAGNSSQELLRLITILHSKKMDIVISLNGLNEIWTVTTDKAIIPENVLASSLTLSGISSGKIKANGQRFYSVSQGIKIKRLFENTNTYKFFFKVQTKLKKYLEKQYSKVADSGAEDARLIYAANKWKKNILFMHSISKSLDTEYRVILQPAFALDLTESELVNFQEIEPINRNLGNKTSISLTISQNYRRQINKLYSHLRKYCSEIYYCIDLSNDKKLNNDWNLYHNRRHHNSIGNSILSKKIIDSINNDRKIKEKMIDVSNN